MTVHELNLHLDGNLSRRAQREKLIVEFLKEEPGTGKGELTSKYIYFVECLQDGNRIYLTRPANLNKGFDFIIHVENHHFSRSDIPSFQEVLQDLREKKEKYPDKYLILHQAILDIYNCKDPANILPNLNNLEFQIGHDIEMLLKVVKWFLIEQDMTYWNYSGRNMFKNALDEIIQNS
jgi:hypothetical protein